jgi:hypothetical protein
MHANNLGAAELSWNDNWTGYDKTWHFGAGMVIGGAVTAYTENPTTGAIAGCGAGFAKEIYDMTNSSTTTVQDVVVTCIGSHIGSRLVDGLYLSTDGVDFSIKF